MKFTKHEAEFLCIALQYAEQWQNSIADSYGNMTKDPAYKNATDEAKRCCKLYEKVRKWLHENGGKVQLTFGKHWEKVSKRMKTGTLEDIKKWHEDKQ